MNDAATVTTTSDAQLLGEVLRHALDGIAVVETRDGITQVAYGNATLAALLRRSEDWVAGHRLEDVEVEAPADPNLTTTGVGSRVRLKRVDGTLVDCERWAVMLTGGRMALYYRPVPRTSPGVLAAEIATIDVMSFCLRPAKSTLVIQSGRSCRSLSPVSSLDTKFS